MRLIYILSTLFFLAGAQKTDTYNFKKILLKDKKLLAESNLIANLSEFEKLAKVDLSTFKFTQTIHGRHKINKWQKSTGDLREVYEITSLVPIDTTFAEKDIKYPAKGVLKFSTFVFKKQTNPKKLIYFSEVNQGLIEYEINNAVTPIPCEDLRLEAMYASTKKEIFDLVEIN